MALIELEPPAGPPPESCGGQVVAFAAARERAEIELVSHLVRFDTDNLFADDGYLSPYTWLRVHTDLRRADSARLIDVARFAVRHLEASAALFTFRLPIAKAAALARVDTPHRRELMERDLVALLAAVEPLDVDDAARVIAQWARLADNEVGQEPADARAKQHLHVSSTVHGMVVLNGMLSPEVGCLVLAALEALDDPDPIDGEVLPRTRAQRRADNLGEMARRSLASDGHLDPDKTVNVIVDADVVPEDDHECHSTDRYSMGDNSTCCGSDGVSGAETERGSDPVRAATGRCEIHGIGPINPQTVRRFLCDSWISRVVMGPKGNVLDLGRRARLFTAAQRRAIIVRDKHCVFPGCDRGPEWCDVHHLNPWQHGGETNVDDGALLCSHGHHPLVHEGGWKLKRDALGNWTATPPERNRPIRC